MSTQINTDNTGYQSPPNLITLDDGRTLYVWINDALPDGSTNAEIQTRIYNTDGTPATAQVNLSSLAAVDNYDGFDWDSLDVDLLPDGKVMLSYVISGGDAGSGAEAPVFAIIEPTASSVNITQTTTYIPQVDGSTYQSPPITTVLDDGNVLFVWSENAISDNTTVDLNGRVYDPDTNTFGNQFPVGNFAVDGTDTADVPNMEIVQLANGEIVVSYVRNAAEAGGNEPVFTILDSSGTTLVSDTEFQQNDTTSLESPALITAMDDGNFMGVWIKNGYSDDSATMTMQGRIFDASGNPVSNEFTLNGPGYSVDGFNSYDIPNFTIDTLDTNHIVVSYVNGSVNDGGYGIGNASDKAHFSIIDVSTPASPTFVAQDVQIPVSPNHGYSGPALIEVLGETGQFVAVYSDDNAASGGTYGLNYRIFDETGAPITGDMPLVVGEASADAVSGSDSFDWANIDVEYSDGSFTVGWVGQDDGWNTGVFSSGPIDVSVYSSDGIVDGAVSAESMSVGYTDAGGDAITDGDDIIYGNDGNDSIYAGDGNDTVDGGLDDELIYGQRGNDVLAGGSGADLVSGESGNDSIDGGVGDDILVGGQGNDTIQGGDDADWIGGDGQLYAVSQFASGPGVNPTNLTVVNNADGPITLWWIDESGTPVEYSTIQPGETHVQPTFEDHNWILRDQEIYFLEYIEGGPNQTINYGAEGLDDTLDGGAGDDTIKGQFGDDSIDGGSGQDIISGGTGQDTIDGGSGDDTIYGEYEATNTVSITSSNFSDTSNGYAVTAQNIVSGAYSSPSAANVSTFGPSFGANGVVSDTDSGVDAQTAYDLASGLSELLIVDFDNPIDQLSFTTYSLQTANFAEVGHYALYNNGTLVYETDFVDSTGTGTDTFDVSGHGSFDQIIFTALIQTDLTDGSDYGISDITFTPTLVGDDYIDGGAGDDSIDGGVGADTLIGGAGADTIDGETGDDIIYGDFDTSDTPPAGFDHYYAAPAYVIGQNFAVTTPNPNGGPEAEELKITDQPLIVRFTDNDSVIDGDNISNEIANDLDQTIEVNGVEYNYAVDYSLQYADSSNVIYTFYMLDLDLDGNGLMDHGSDGGNNNVMLQVGGPTLPAGADLTIVPNGLVGVESLNYDSFDNLSAYNFDDSLTGADGDDTIVGGDGSDEIYGNAGDDRLDGGLGNDTVYGGTGSDTILLNDGYLGDSIVGGEDPDNLDVDTLDASGVTNDGVDVFISGGESGSITSTEGTANFSEIESFTLTDQADSFNGNFSTADITVDAGAGDDTLVGGAGDNTLRGGDGDDVFTVGIGNDTIFGGTGSDTIIADDPIELTFTGDGQGVFNDIPDNDSGQFQEIEVIQGSSGDDSLDASGDSTGVTLFGNDGADTIIGGSGGDSLSGGNDNDTISGAEGDDTINGGAGNDTIYGDESAAFVYNTADGQLFTYDPVSGTSTQLTSGLMTYGDIATTLDGTLYGVVLDSMETSSDAGIYEIDPVTGNETLVYDLPENVGWNAGLASDPSGNLYFADSDLGTVTRIEPDGLGSFTNPTVVLNYSGNITDIAFVDDGTAWVVYANNTIEAYDVDGSGNFTTPSSLGSIPGASFLTGVVRAENGLIYATDEDGAVFSTDPTSLPPTWTAEAGTGDTIYGVASIPAGLSSSGNDTIDGGTGDDTIVAGDGDDTIDGGAGADLLIGGSGADVFIADGTNDTISDFDTTTGIGNASTTDNDFIDLTSYYNQTNLDAWNAANPGQTYASPLAWLQADQADGTLDQADGLQIQEGGSAVAPSALTAENTGVVCFAQGTRIRVPGGEMPIEMLRSGDLVQTRDNGVKPIVWIGHRSLDQEELLQTPNLLPVLLKAGHFNLEHDLIVSPQHGILLRDPNNGGTDVLYRARHLAEMKGGGARIMKGRRRVTYFHMLFDQHEVVFSNGIPSESLYPGPRALKSLSAPAQIEVSTLFPDLKNHNVINAFGAPTTIYSRRKELPARLREIRTTH